MDAKLLIPEHYFIDHIRYKDIYNLVLYYDSHKGFYRKLSGFDNWVIYELRQNNLVENSVAHLTNEHMRMLLSILMKYKPIPTIPPYLTIVSRFPDDILLNEKLEHLVILLLMLYFVKGKNNYLHLLEQINIEKIVPYDLTKIDIPKIWSEHEVNVYKFINNSQLMEECKIEMNLKNNNPNLAGCQIYSPIIYKQIDNIPNPIPTTTNNIQTQMINPVQTNEQNNNINNEHHQTEQDQPIKQNKQNYNKCRKQQMNVRD